MGLTREEWLKRRVQALLDDYADHAKRVPKLKIVGYCVVEVTNEPFTTFEK